MRKALHGLGAMIAAQPFYADEINMIGLVLQTWRYALTFPPNR